jgi:hypothetical protein
MTNALDLLRLKLAETFALRPRETTRRDVRLPGFAGKA